MTEEGCSAGVEAHVATQRALILRWVQRPRGEALLDELLRVVALDEPVGYLGEAIAEEIAVGEEDEPPHLVVLD